MGKTIERMRSNPRADWGIGDVEKACREAGIACIGHRMYEADRRIALQDRQSARREAAYDTRPPPDKTGVYYNVGTVPRRRGRKMTKAEELVVADGTRFDPAAYEVVLRPLDADEGGGWLATIPALPGCMGDGETEVEAIADVRLAAQEWAHAALGEGDVIPAPTRSTTVAAE